MDIKNIIKIIEQWDPMDLAPEEIDNEYIFEAEKIKSFLDRMETIDNEKLAAEIQRVFKEAFEPVFQRSYEECFEIAIKILTVSK